MTTKRKAKKTAICLKLDPAILQFVRERAEAENTPMTAIHERALLFLQTRTRIEERVRASIGRNRERYGDTEAFMRATNNSRHLCFSDAVNRIEYDEFLREHVYRSLEDWERMNRSAEYLNNVLLKAEYFLSPEADTISLPFTEETTDTEHSETPPAQAPAKPRQAKRSGKRNKVEATA